MFILEKGMDLPEIEEVGDQSRPEFRNNPDDNFMVALFADHWLR